MPSEIEMPAHTPGAEALRRLLERVFEDKPGRWRVRLAPVRAPLWEARFWTVSIIVPSGTAVQGFSFDPSLGPEELAARVESAAANLLSRARAHPPPLDPGLATGGRGRESLAEAATSGAPEVATGKATP